MSPAWCAMAANPAATGPRDPAITEAIAAHLRSYESALAYPPNRVFLGHQHPDSLTSLSRPWFQQLSGGERWGPHGEMMPEEEFYGLLKICDAFDLVSLESRFVEEISPALAAHPLLTPADLERLGSGVSDNQIASTIRDTTQALPLYLGNGRRHRLCAGGPSGRQVADGRCTTGKSGLQGDRRHGPAYPAGAGAD